MSDLTRILTETENLINTSIRCNSAFMRGIRGELEQPTVLVPGKARATGPNNHEAHYNLMDAHNAILATLRAVLQALKHIHAETQSIKTLVVTTPLVNITKGEDKCGQD